jgi:hypothetical protein
MEDVVQVRGTQPESDWCNVVAMVETRAPLPLSAVLRALVLALAGLFVLTAEQRAWAGPKIDDLTKQLASEDFRVRTQAALALGASGDAAAVKPLCGAIKDSNQTVRLAVVAGLGKLGKDGGATCIRSAKSDEKDAAVVSAMEKALENIALGGDPPLPGAGAKYYVAIQVINRTNRPQLEVEGVVRRALSEKLLASSANAIAPRNETNPQASNVLKARNLKGYLLSVGVEPYSYGGGNLTVQLKVAMSTYPDRSLKAEFSPKLTQKDTPKQDSEAEKLLVKMAAQTAGDSFNKVVASL